MSIKITAELHIIIIITIIIQCDNLQNQQLRVTLQALQDTINRNQHGNEQSRCRPSEPYKLYSKKRKGNKQTTFRQKGGRTQSMERGCTLQTNHSDDILVSAPTDSTPNHVESIEVLHAH